MPVNLPLPVAEQLYPVEGVSIGVASAGIRKGGRKDFLIVRSLRAAKSQGCLRKTPFVLPQSKSVSDISRRGQEFVPGS